MYAYEIFTFFTQFSIHEKSFTLFCLYDRCITVTVKQYIYIQIPNFKQNKMDVFDFSNRIQTLKTVSLRLITSQFKDILNTHKN